MDERKAESGHAEGLTLGGIESGKQGIVRALRGGRAFCSRAANLGFTTGAPVDVIQNFGHGPLIVAVRGARVALGRAEAENVLVDLAPVAAA